MRNPSSGFWAIRYHWITAVGKNFHRDSSWLQWYLPVHTEQGLKHAFTTFYKVKSEKLEVFNLCHLWQKVSAASRGIQRQKKGHSLDSWACTEVSICFPALTDKVPSSLLDRQLKEKRKLGVRQENDSAYFRYLTLLTNSSSRAASSTYRVL